jgi:hypothetical protein
MDTDFATSITLGDYCLLAQHKEHTIKRNFLLDMLNKQPVSPQSGQEAHNYPNSAIRISKFTS